MPRSNGPLTRVLTLLPRGAREKLGHALGGDTALETVDRKTRDMIYEDPRGSLRSPRSRRMQRRPRRRKRKPRRFRWGPASAGHYDLRDAAGVWPAPAPLEAAPLPIARAGAHIARGSRRPRAAGGPRARGGRRRGRHRRPRRRRLVPDLLLTRGEYQFKAEPPFVPGVEVAGVVRSAPAGCSSPQATA